MLDRNQVSRFFLLLTLFGFLLAFTLATDFEGITTQSTKVASEPQKKGMPLADTPHGPIVIDGDNDFATSALNEGWPGDGSPENPFIIDGLEIDIENESGHCIDIRNTRVSFIISNCSFAGASRESGAGIQLYNVKHSELVKNILDGNYFGIYLDHSDSNIITNNICCNNAENGISLWGSFYNTVTNNTCKTGAGIYLYRSHGNTISNNTGFGIDLQFSTSNTVVNNICNYNDFGVRLYSSDSNIVSDNICSNNAENGISLGKSDSNTVTHNTCNSNGFGISLEESDSNTVTHNTCINNTVNDLYIYDLDLNTVTNNITTTFVFSSLLELIRLLGITMFGAGWWKVSAKGGQNYTFVPTRHRMASWLRKRKSLKQIEDKQDGLIVPIRYLLASWFHKRRSLKHVVVDEPLEPDSLDE